MEFEKFEKRVASSDGINTLVGTVFVPQGEIKGIFHLVHGMTEYIDRYEELMSFIASHGFLCFGFDNLGHGRTAKEGDLGFIAHRNGYSYLVKDVGVFADEIRKEYSKLPYILMGHSMGSFIVRLYAAKFGDKIDRLIICGTAGKNKIALLGLALCNIIKTFKGERAISPIIESAAFGAYNKRFEGLSNHDWLTTDRSVIEKYEKDKYCNFHFTVSAMHDLVKLNYLCNKKECFQNTPKTKPIFIIAGDMDPVGDYGNGVKEVYENFIKSEHTNTDLILYENCRHEIHNDSCRKQMADDIIKFISE